MKTDLCKVIFSDEYRTTLQGLDDWARGWVHEKGLQFPRKMQKAEISSLPKRWKSLGEN